jgi:hypothetical protein
MGIEVIFLVLAILVVAFGIGVVIISRRNAGRGTPPMSRTTRPAAPPPRPDGGSGDTGTLVEERPDELVEPEPEAEPEA